MIYSENVSLQHQGMPRGSSELNNSHRAAGDSAGVSQTAGDQELCAFIHWLLCCSSSS